MAVNLAKRRLQHLIAKEQYELENAAAINEEAQKIIEEHKKALEDHKEAQAQRILELRSDPRYLGPSSAEAVFNPKQIQRLVEKKIEKKIIGHQEESPVDNVTATIEPVIDGTVDAFNFGTPVEPAEVLAEKAANEKPERSAKAIKSQPQVKKTKAQSKAKAQEISATADNLGNENKGE